MSKYLAIGLLLLQLNAYAQQPTAGTWRYIDSSLMISKNIGDIDSLVGQLCAKAMSDKNYFIAARCYQYRVVIADLRSEDSFYFRNSSVIDSVLQTSDADPSLQLALHLLQAKRLFAFTTRSQRFDRSSYQSKDIPVDYATYNDEQIDSIALHHFEEAGKLADRIPAVATDHFTWLATDPAVFFFRPSIKDVIMAEHIRAIGNTRNYWRIDGLQDRWMQLSPDAFIEKMDSAAHTSDKTFEVLKQYYRWLQLHRNDPATYYYIESLARKHFSDNEGYFSNLLVDGTTGEKVYEEYLEKLLSSPYNIVKAHAVYQLCLMRFKQSKRYRESAELPSWTAYTYGRYDTAYRYHADKALNLSAQHKTMLDSFALVKNDLLLLEKEILKSQCNIRIANINIPGEPILTELNHKNVNTLHYRIVKRDSLTRGATNYEQRHVNRWLRLPAVVQQQMIMPATNDHNEHISYLKLDPLKAGQYALLFSSRPFTDTSAKVESVLFDVSSIAVLQNDKTIFVVDRKAGMPLKNAIAKASADAVVKGKDGKKINKTIFQTLASNEQGFVQFTIKNSIKEIQVAYRGDTLTQMIRNDDDEYPAADQTTMDDRVTAFMSDTRAYIYTDRAIYRPGQTVHYKIVFITKDQTTRREMLATKSNLGLFGGKSVYDAWMKEYEPVIYIKDPFDRSIDTIPVKISDLGSMSGSFRIPKNAATGQWEFGGEGFDVNYGSYIRVEEYRRPAYGISIDKPETELYPKDSFRFTINVRSFAGAELANVRVKYRVERKGSLPVIDLNTGKERIDYITDTLLDATGFTNEKGELAVLVYDTALLKKVFVDTLEWTFNYNIDAEATDETGENHTASNEVYISTRPIEIMMDTRDPFDRNKKMLLPVSVQHALAGEVRKNITIKISREETPVKVTEQRRLSKTDIWLYPKQQLQLWFPYTDFDIEEPKPVKKQVFETTVNTGKTGEIGLDPDIFTPGHYVAEITCIENGRVIGEKITEFDVYDGKKNIWAERTLYAGHLYNSYLLNKGDTIKYMHGNTETPAYSVYQLVYLSGKNKTTKRIVHTSMQQPGIHTWIRKLPADARDEAYFIHFYVLNNETYSKTQQITIASNDSLPKIAIERFRRKMTPGQKETFIVSLKSEEIRPIAEIAATLYDATLDKLADHSWDIPDSYERKIAGDWESGMYRVAAKATTHTGNGYAWDFGYQLPELSRVSPVWWAGAGELQTIGMLKYTPPLFIKGGHYMYDMNPDARLRSDISGGLGANTGYYLGSDDGVIDVGWGGGVGLTGNVGVTFNNFSINNIFGDTAPSRFTYMLGFEPDRDGARNYRRGNVIDYVTSTAVPFLRINPDALAKSIVRIDKGTKLNEMMQSMIYIDGVLYKGNSSTLDISTYKTALVLKDDDAALIYGEQARKGVLVLNTGDDLIFIAPESPMPLRKNFNETAFFFPAIHADKDGRYSMSFTMPESVTEWNWKLLAHTKNMEFAYAEEKILTQLPLMVQPNMPRVLYQGDRIVLKSRITNLDTITVNGKLACKVEDVATGEDITASVVAKSQQDFKVESKTNSSGAFELIVPKDQLNPLKISIAGRSGSFSDGEEHVIPVLSTGIFVKQSFPFSFTGRKLNVTISHGRGADRAMISPLIPFGTQNAEITLPGLPDGAKAEGISISMQPQPQAAILDALPYLTGYPHGCAEQVTNKIVSYLTAMQIMRTDSNAQQAFDNAIKKSDEPAATDEAMPGELEESLTPWISLRHANKRRQEKLLRVLDTVQSNEKIKEYLKYLYNLQNEDGGLSWFPKGRSDIYMSNYVLLSFGQLRQQGLLDNDDLFDREYESFINDLVGYCTEQFVKYVGERSSLLESFHIYAFGYWSDLFAITPGFGEKQKRVIERGMIGIDKYGLGQQAIQVITILRNVNPDSSLYKAAVAHLRSLQQRAISDERNGVRWKEITEPDDFDHSGEEKIALLAEAFGLVKEYKNIPAEIVKWLVYARTDHHWTSTRATAAVIHTIQKESQIVSPVQTITAKPASAILTITNNPFKGDLQSYTQVKALPASIPLSKTNNDPADGYLSYYYFSKTAPVNGYNVQLNKKLSRWNESKKEWEIINETTLLHAGEKVQASLTIQSPRALQYVYINDSRSAAFEPVDNSSDYQYDAGFAYYRSVKDAGFRFFANTIPSGEHTITYEMKVSQEGRFTNGMAVLQCMYRPEVAAYSNSIVVQVR